MAKDLPPSVFDCIVDVKAVSTVYIWRSESISPELGGCEVVWTLRRQTNYAFIEEAGRDKSFHRHIHVARALPCLGGFEEEQ